MAFGIQKSLLQTSKNDENLKKKFETVCEEFLDFFEKKECVKFSILSFEKICSQELLLKFLSQFEIYSKSECERDEKLHKEIQSVFVNTGQFLEFQNHPFNENTHEHTEMIEARFNYLKGDRFYDPPSTSYTTERILNKLELICAEYQY